MDTGRGRLRAGIMPAAALSPRELAVGGPPALGLAVGRAVAPRPAVSVAGHNLPRAHAAPAVAAGRRLLRRRYQSALMRARDFFRHGAEQYLALWWAGENSLPHSPHCTMRSLAASALRRAA